MHAKKDIQNVVLGTDYDIHQDEFISRYLARTRRPVYLPTYWCKCVCVGGGLG